MKMNMNFCKRCLLAIQIIALQYIFYTMIFKFLNQFNACIIKILFRKKLRAD